MEKRQTTHDLANQSIANELAMTGISSDGAPNWVAEAGMLFFHSRSIRFQSREEYTLF
jgi:hypothetical protein